MKFLYIFILLFTVTVFSFENNEEKEIAKLTNSQKVSKASSMIATMESTLKEAYTILKRTRKEKDLIKLNCVNESIKKIKGLLKRSKDDSINLQEAISKDDNKSTNYYYTKISLASGNIKQAGIETLSCTGTVTIEMTPVVGVSVEDLVVEKDYVEENNGDLTIEEVKSNVELEPVLASPYF